MSVSVTAEATEGRGTRARRPRLRRLRALPRAMWLCAALAIVNALIWALLTPPGQGPDEPAHASYAQTIAAGRLPGSTSKKGLKQDMGLTNDWLAVLHQMPWASEGVVSWAPQEAQLLRRTESHNRLTQGGASYVTNNPPLYYALDAIPARLASGLDFFNRLFVMRAFSALFAAVTTCFAFLFLRELFPRQQWMWVVGAVAVAFQPVFGMISGTVHVDNALDASGAALFYTVARAFRRGLSPKLGLGIGAAALAGALSKGTSFGLMPGALLGLLALAWRSQGPIRRRSFKSIGVAVGTMLGGYAAWLAVSSLAFGRQGFATAETLSRHTATQPITIKGQLSYTWQFFLPKLPFMTSQHLPGDPKYGLWNVYIEGFVGRFGWFQYGYPTWANVVGALVIGLVVIGAALAFRRTSGAFSRRWLEFGTYALMFLGNLALVSIAAYRYHATNGLTFEQARYLLPCVVLWGALVAVGARGLGGRRFAPAVGVFLTVLIVSDTLFAFLLTLGRFWGYLYA